MSGVDWDLVSEIFADALEQPLRARSAFVAARCADQPDVRSAVERLLAAETAAGPDFMKGVAAATMGDAIRALVETPGRLGAYRLVREIGRGGMGQVFLAERDDGQFQQRTAIKLLKRGMDTDAILALFLRERQILAALNHPNIARLIDGGMSDDGRPYFVMEYVEGRPITVYSDEQRLSIDERLDLFCAVCLAVEHAHRNLVVHRDLKPSNILITGDGQPKLLDFGIAKLLAAGHDDADAMTLTPAGVRMLTPEYAAPEQFRAGAITTSTDVYSLGAVLYELIAGVRPFAARHDTALPAHLLDEEAPLLTHALAQASNSPMGSASSLVAVVATARSTDSDRLRRRVAGDLETIVATALRPSPDRRYASVEALRDDIHRYQQRRPVKARPTTAAYRLLQFVRRNRVAVFSVATIVAVVLAFGGTAVVQASRIRDQANELEVERDRARIESAAAEKVADFLVSVFEVSDPTTEGRGDSIRARELLDRGAARIETDLDGQPELQARMLTVIGRAFHNLSRSDRAEQLLQRAVELQKNGGVETSGTVVATLQQLARVQLRRGDYGAARTNLQDAMARQERIDAEDPMMLALLADLAAVFHEQGDSAGVARTVAESLERVKNLPPTGFADSRETLGQLAVFLSYAREWELVDELHRRWVELERSAAPGSEAVAVAYTSWAEARQRSGRAQSADSLRPLALAIFRENDSRSLATADALLKLGSVTGAAGNPDRKDSLFRAAIDIYRERLGDDHRRVADARALLATHLRRDRPAEAIPLFASVLAVYRREAETALVVPVYEWQLAVAMRDAGQIEESAPVFETALSAFERSFPPDYILTANLRHDFGRTLIELDRAAEAEPMVLLAIPVLAKRWGANDFRVDDARITLVRALTSRGRYAEAAKILEGALDRLQRGRGPDDPYTRRAVDARDALRLARSRRER